MSRPSWRRAWGQVRNAIKQGKIAKAETCARCGKAGRLQAHHSDYSRPLDVEWLCTRCHAFLHNMEGGPSKWGSRFRGAPEGGSR